MDMITLFDPGPTESGGAVGASTNGATITGGGSNVESAWVEMESATPREYAGLLLMVSGGASYSRRNALVDVGIGGAGSEVVIVPNLYFKTGDAATTPIVSQIFIPISIPSGARLAVRQQNTGNATFNICVVGVSKGFLQADSYQAADAIGADSSDSGGTLTDPGATANTKGAWAQLTASAPECSCLLIGLGKTTPGNLTSCRHLVDIAIGGAGSEQVIIADLFTVTHGDIQNHPIFLPVKIPAGARVAARSACSSNTAGARELDVALVGFR